MRSKSSTRRRRADLRSEEEMLCARCNCDGIRFKSTLREQDKVMALSQQWMASPAVHHGMVSCEVCGAPQTVMPPWMGGLNAIAATVLGRCCDASGACISPKMRTRTSSSHCARAGALRHLRRIALIASLWAATGDLFQSGALHTMRGARRVSFTQRATDPRPPKTHANSRAAFTARASYGASVSACYCTGSADAAKAMLKTTRFGVRPAALRQPEGAKRWLRANGLVRGMRRGSPCCRYGSESTEGSAGSASSSWPGSSSRELRRKQACGGLSLAGVWRALEPGGEVTRAGLEAASERVGGECGAQLT
eukprot:SAG31_NODE_2326_length_5940_cov_2.687896_6_plen_308_part_01